MENGLNYFNYFTEIEEEFVRRRGSHLLISPLDWSLIEGWKQRGIPLHVVLRGIIGSFESHDPQKRHGRKVNSLFYCQQEVEVCFQQYQQSRVGSQETDGAAQNGEAAARPEKRPGQIDVIEDAGSPFSRESILEYVAGQRAAFQRLRQNHAGDVELTELFSRAETRLAEITNDLTLAKTIHHENLESDLTTIEELTLEGLKRSLGAEQLSALQKEADKQLRSYKKGMEKAVYEQTRDNYVARCLREQFRVPRLSLFYL
ncbi:MAG: hypothetical protein ACKV2V_28465 [Blastocatellia bacterium]